MDELITLATFASPVEANLARSRLEAAGIRVILADEHIVAVFWPLTSAVGEIKLQVAARDVNQAQALLAEPLPAGKEGMVAALCCLACGTLMGATDTCSACGWSYGLEPDAAPDPDLDLPPVDAAAGEDEPEAGGLEREESPTHGSDDAVAPPALPAPAVWGEVGAVLAVGVLPHLVHSVSSFAVPPSPPVPYWADALDLTALRICSIIPTRRICDAV